jgi:hypothetical protein
MHILAVEQSEWAAIGQRALYRAPLPNASVVGIHYPVIPLRILPGREFLCCCLEHPRPISLPRQHPHRSNDHIFYDVAWDELAAELRYPDAMYGEVRQIVDTFAGHESLPPNC